MLSSLSSMFINLKYVKEMMYLVIIPLLFAIIINLLAGFLARYIAREKGYTDSLWFWVGFILGIVGMVGVAGLPDRKFIHINLKEIFTKITRLTREGIISGENYKRLIKIQREVNFFGEVSLETHKVLDELLLSGHLSKEEAETLGNLKKIN